MKRYYSVIMVFCLVLAGSMIFALRTGSAQAQSERDDSEQYRVELVQNDQYKIQKGLNSMARQGFYYVSSISRTDGKVLLVFRRHDQ